MRQPEETLTDLINIKGKRRLASVTAEFGQWREAVPYKVLNFACRMPERSAMVCYTQL